MSDHEAQRPLKDRIEEKIRGWIDDLAEALDDTFGPAREPVPIPVRDRR